MSDDSKAASTPRIPVDASDPEVRAVMDAARRAQEEVRSWPAWKRGDASAPPVTEQAGAKHDQGKLRWTLLPWDAIEQVVRILEFGVRKYSEGGWMTVPNARRRYLDALIRHAVAYAAGEREDADSKLPTMAHVACNALFLLWFDLRAATPPSANRE